MIASVALLACAVASVVRAQTATIFPVGFAGDGLTGEIVGTGATGTTYVLEGSTDGLAFTMTLVEGASLLAETVAIPVVSVDIAVGCIISAGSALCQDVVEGVGGDPTAKITSIETVTFAPIAVPVATSGVTSASSTSIDTSASSTASTESESSIPSSTSSAESSSVLTSSSSAISSSPSSSSSALSSSVSSVISSISSAISSASTSAITSLSSSSSATGPVIAPPASTSASPSSGTSSYSMLGLSGLLPIAGVLCILF